MNRSARAGCRARDRGARGARGARWCSTTRAHIRLDSQIHQATLYTAGDRLVLDDAAVRNLELVRTLDGERRGSLLHLLDETKTPMGARALRSRLLEPLTDIERIRRRHDAVELFFLDARCRDQARARLGEIGDLERLAVRTAVGLATPRDLGVIRNSLVSANALHAQLSDRPGSDLDDAMASLQGADLCADVLTLLQAALVDEPPAIDRQGGIFADGHLDELDDLRKLSTTAKDIVLDLERRERERTGIGSLKIKFTRVFGYYIEITKSKLDAVPDEYVRKQTIANGERFITAELAELQDRILHADERARALESAAFVDLRKPSATRRRDFTGSHESSPRSTRAPPSPRSHTGADTFARPSTPAVSSSSKIAVTRPSNATPPRTASSPTPSSSTPRAPASCCSRGQTCRASRPRCDRLRSR